MARIRDRIISYHYLLTMHSRQCCNASFRFALHWWDLLEVAHTNTTNNT